jgi:hypothetical protein
MAVPAAVSSESLNLKKITNGKVVDEDKKMYKLEQDAFKEYAKEQEEDAKAIWENKQEMLKLGEKADEDYSKHEEERAKAIFEEQEESDKLIGELSIAAKRHESSDRLKEMTSELKKERDLLSVAGKNTLAIDKALSDARLAIRRAESREKMDFIFSETNFELSMLATLADGIKKDLVLKKTIAGASALIQGAEGVMGILAHSGDFIAMLGPVAGPIMEGAEISTTVAATIAQIAKIASAKTMAYGGIATGGIQGRDSIPALLMPGEVVYNPMHPNPALASLIGGSSNTTNTSTTHIHAGTIVVQGNVDQKTVNRIAEVSERALVSAMRKAQVMGKITAPGLVVRG